MEDLSFAWGGPGSLPDLLKEPLIRVSTPDSYEGEIFALKFWRAGGGALVVQSKMQDLSGREEVGVLAFQAVSAAPTAEREFCFQKEGGAVESLRKITVFEDGFGIVDCGFDLSMTGGGIITVVAGNFPRSLAVTGIPGLSREFQPEYPWDRYRFEHWIL